MECFYPVIKKMAVSLRKFLKRFYYTPANHIVQSYILLIFFR